MKLRSFLSVALIALVSLMSCASGGKKKTVVLENESDSVSYCLGITFGANIKSSFTDVQADVIAAAIADVYADEELKMTAEEETQYLRQGCMAMQEQKGAGNKQEGEAFLAENAKKEGVQTTESGLQYEIIEEGTGASPKASDQVKVHYRGTLINGEQFDSSYDRGQPATFGVGQVIPGWTEALQLMKEGGKWKLYIPSELAYGEQAPASIGPNQVLIFDVELLEIVE